MKMSRLCMSVSTSGMGTFIEKIIGMDQAAQKWGEGGGLKSPAPPPVQPLLMRAVDRKVHTTRWNPVMVSTINKNGHIIPFTPKSSQFQISPAALHHTARINWLSIA